jgi:hypothetical protein
MLRQRLLWVLQLLSGTQHTEPGNSGCCESKGCSASLMTTACWHAIPQHLLDLEQCAWGSAMISFKPSSTAASLVMRDLHHKAFLACDWRMALQQYTYAVSVCISTTLYYTAFSADSRQRYHFLACDLGQLLSTAASPCHHRREANRDRYPNR